MKKVIAFGTFDIFHPGHASYLKQARELGDHLLVVVARDENVFALKKQLPERDEEERLAQVKESQLAQEVVLGDAVDRYKIIESYRPDVIALGYDQQVDEAELAKKLQEFGLKETQVVRLKSFEPEKYKSSKLKS